MSTARLTAESEAHRPTLPILIAIIASMMGLAALSIDIMLPALPAISDTFGLADPNQRQLVITFYLFGFAAGQLLYGPLSDSFGRKPVLIVGLAIYAAASLATYVASDYSTLLLARAFQGVGCAAPRIIALAVVRDLFGGRQMARVMSFVMMVFIIVPVIAPSLGEGLMLFGDWRWIFLLLLAASLVLLGLTAWGLPETRPIELRARLSLRWIGRAVLRVVSTRQTLGYTLATGFVFGCLMSYINSAQQIFEGIYGLDALFPLVFGAIAIFLAGASLTNGAMVRRHGMRRMSHTAMLGFVIVAAVHLIVVLAYGGSPPIIVFAGFLALNLFLFGFLMPNFNALAMEPLREIAGTASSFIGFFTTGSAALFGWVVGQSFNDTVIPLTAGYLILSSIALLVVTLTEGGRLFRAVNSP